MELTRSFDATDQHAFAQASGDSNPMHVDEVAARRTIAGGPVVHGVHGVLWAIDALAAAGEIVQPIATIDVQFRKFIYVGDRIALRAQPSADALRIDILSGQV